ncbi:MAG: TetR/AcrR family transcriptional regulator [Nocardioides sp.]
MPKVVDVEERRASLAAAVLAVVGNSGVDGLTVRAVAAQAGMSPGLVHHYFPQGKAALLHAAVSLAVSRGVERMLSVLEDRRGLQAVRAAAFELLPVTEERQAEWTAWASLWREILTVPSLRLEQVERLASWRAVLETLLTQAAVDGELAAGSDSRLMALQLAAFLDGLGLHAVIDPQLLPPSSLMTHVESFLATVAR